jgi:ABC-type branched-subunit amino acid transport system substrate-binding protein
MLAASMSLSMSSPGPRCRYRRRCVALIAVAAVLALAACRSARPPRADFVGDTHAGSGGAAGEPASRPAASAAELTDALARALAEGRAEQAIGLASALAAAGGALDEATWAAVRAAVDRVPASRLAALWGTLDARQPPSAHVALRLARVAAHAGSEREARAWLARVRDAGAGPDQAWVAERARELGAALRRGRAVDPAVLAVLLPLSGRHARVGSEMRAAIELAAADAASGARLVFLDTAGDPARAVRAVEDAVQRHRAVGILGPVGQQTALAAAARAAELGVPIALLAPADDAGSGPGSGPGSGADAAVGVFRLWSSAAWEAAEAARLAVALGHTRLAVLAPRDEHGEVAAAVFAAQARALGAEVQRGGYDPTGSELEPDLRAFLGLTPLTNERLRRHLRRQGRDGWKTFTPDIGFELLYIPDEHERAALVASFLPYYNVEVRSEGFMDSVALRRKHGGRVPQVVQLLGSSGWHHPSLPMRGGPAVEGALVVDIYAGGDGEDFLGDDAARFAQSFHDRTGRWPGRVAAEAYDAAVIVLAARARVGASDSRAAFARALAGAELGLGVCGPARVAGGSLVREAVLLRVEDGAFVLHDF